MKPFYFVETKTEAEILRVKETLLNIGFTESIRLPVEGGGILICFSEAMFFVTNFTNNHSDEKISTEEFFQLDFEAEMIISKIRFS